MYFSDKEKYALAMLAAGMLQAGLKDGVISNSQWQSAILSVCNKLNAPQTIFKWHLSIDPFSIIRNMKNDQNEFVKTFLYGVFQQVPTCEKAAHYFVTTLENSGLIIED